VNSKAIAAAALIVASLPAAALEDADVYLQARASLVQLVAGSSEGRYWLGSGVALPGGAVVTNCHVTHHANGVAPFWDNSGVRAESQRADVLHDLCVIRIPGLSLRPARVASSRDLKVGDKVYAIGFNGGRRLTYDTGEVSDLFNYDGGMVIRTTAAFSQGASGGGLFDAQGRLVGILTFFRVSGETAYFAVPVEWISSVEQVAPSTIHPIDGIAFWAQALERQPPFLHAGALEADRDWEKLFEFATTWAQSDPSDRHAWYTLAKAASETGRHETAKAAVKRAAQYDIAGDDHYVAVTAVVAP